jgi:hypothetical protein
LDFLPAAAENRSFMAADYGDGMDGKQAACGRMIQDDPQDIEGNIDDRSTAAGP